MENTIHKRKKKFNIATPYTLFCLAVLLVTSIFTSGLITRENTDHINSILSLISDKVNTCFSMMADYTTQAADMFSAMNNRPYEEAYIEMQKTLDNMPYNNVGLILNDGTVYATEGEKLDIQRHDFAEKAREVNELYITEPYRSCVTADNMITLFAPIYSNGERCGSIYTTYYLKTVQQLAATSSNYENANIYLINPYSSNYVYCWDNGETPPGTWGNLKLVKNDLSHKDNIKIDTWVENMKNTSDDNIINYSLKNTKYSLAYVNIEDMQYWNIAIRMANSELSSTMQQFILYVVICAVLLIVATFVFTGSAYMTEHNRSLKLQTLSNIDPLTKIINRRALNTKIDGFIADNPNHPRCTYIFLDVDFFKEVNDTYGHDGGDQVLCSVASILSKEFEDIGLVARVGGDEFNIFVYEPISRENIDKLMQQLKVRFDGIHRSLKQTMPIHFSAGISSCPDDAGDIKSLVALADKALYHTKQHGRNNYCWYGDIKNETLEQNTDKNRI